MLLLISFFHYIHGHFVLYTGSIPQNVRIYLYLARNNQVQSNFAVFMSCIRFSFLLSFLYLRNLPRLVCFIDDEFSDIVRDILSSDEHQNLSCVYLPDDLVVITACNSWQFDLLVLQRAGINSFINQHFRRIDFVEPSTQCLSRRLMTVCLDDECMNLCVGHNIERCVRFFSKPVSTYNSRDRIFAWVNPSPFGSHDYNYVTYLKWEFIARAISVGAKTIFSLDIDVLLLRDPFQLVQIQQLMHSSQILHQSGKGDGCFSRVNSGVMILKSSLMYVVIEMLKMKEGILASKQVEQEVLQSILDNKRFNVTRCSLPRRIFTGHCGHLLIDDIPITDIVTYHAHCNKNQFHKVALMTHFLNRVIAAKSLLYPSNVTFKKGELETIKG